MRRISEVIVVEGKKDTQAIQRAVEADTIETNGLAISKHVLSMIERASKKRGVIVFTDPDFPGEQIRRIISEKVPKVKHAFLSRSQARKDRKIGIEFASKEAIIQALDQVRDPIELHLQDEVEYPISWSDYIELGFSGKTYSSSLREKVADELGIGYGNAKKFYHRLAVLQISSEELFHAVEEARRSIFS